MQLKRIYSIIKIVCVSTNGLLSDLKREVDTMVLLDELRVTMSDYQKDMDELYEVLGVAAATERYNALQEEIAKEGFWDDLEHSQKVLQESKTLENRINSYKKMQSELEDIITLIELSIEEGETESTPDWKWKKFKIT